MRILLVDDEATVLFALAAELCDHGLDVLPCKSADDAVVQLRSDRKISIVVTDIRMPGAMNGLGLTRHVKGRYPQLPVIIVSGETTGRDVPDIADARLTKPVDVSELIEVIKRLTNR